MVSTALQAQLPPQAPPTERREPAPGTRRQIARPAAGLVALLAGLGLSVSLPAGQSAHAAGPLDWHIMRNGPSGQQVRSGLGIRLVNVTNDDVLAYGERDYGINLVWSSSPVFEWEVFGGTHGAPVVAGPTYYHGLRNSAVQRAMVYGERKYGINLVWY
jgi:hypothetical protein